MDDIKIGDKFWSFELNRRVYRKDENGRSVGGPIYREHFYRVEVIGETSRSWIIGTEGSNWAVFKVPKADPFREKAGEFGSRPMIFTDAMVDDECFVKEHRYPIARAVESCRSPAKLRQIAEIVGYEVNHD